MELLERTAAYILENGVADLSLRPLAKAVGTSARMIVYQFGSRERLIESALKQILGGIQRDFVEAQQSVLDFWNWALKPKNQPYVRLIFEVHGLAPRNPGMYGGYVRDAIARWKAILKTRGYDEVRATALIAVFDGLADGFPGYRRSQTHHAGAAARAEKTRRCEMKRYAITGFAIWAAATLALRIAGGVMIRIPAPLLLLITLPLMIAVAVTVLRDAPQRAAAAIALVAPGMLLDTISTIWFSRVFPNIPSDAAGLFGGWLLFCNVVVLLTAVTIAPRPASESAAQSR